MTPSHKYDTFISEVRKMKKPNPKKAKMHLEKIRQLMSKVSSPYKGMTKQQIIDEIRKTRQKLWEERVAARPR